MEETKSNSSKYLWYLEKEAMKMSENKKVLELIDILDPLIESEKVLYEDFVENLIHKFEQYSTEEYDDSIEGRTELVNKIYSELIEEYKQK